MNQDRTFKGNLYRKPDALASWLSQGGETAIETDMPIVDAHHHLWNDERGKYELPDFVADAAGNNLIGSVFVECGTNYHADVDYNADATTPIDLASGPARETAYVRDTIEVNRAADEQGFCKGIVGFTNLLLGSASTGRLLEAHAKEGGGRFRGVRQSTAFDPAIGAFAYRSAPPGMLLDQRFRSGFGELARFNVTFDVWVFYPQLNDLIDLAAAFPDTTIVLDHYGGLLGISPYSRYPKEVFDTWRNYIRKVALLPNIMIKIGGLGMPATGSQFHFDDQPPRSEALAKAWKPYVETTVEAFGPHRCMIESNFPVDRQTSSYTTMWNAYKIATRQYAKEERTSLFHGTANRVYRLNLNASAKASVQQVSI